MDGNILVAPFPHRKRAKLQVTLGAAATCVRDGNGKAYHIQRMVTCGFESHRAHMKNAVAIKGDAWAKFIDVVDMDGETNFKVGFDVLTKKFGQAYIEFCRAMWEANDGVMDEDEFMRMNGGMPRSFFERTIRRG